MRLVSYTKLNKDARTLQIQEVRTLDENNPLTRKNFRFVSVSHGLRDSPHERRESEIFGLAETQNSPVIYKSRASLRLITARQANMNYEQS